MCHNYCSFYGEEGWKTLKGAIASLILAGTDTSASALEWFLLYMTMFPEVQEKCFQEIHEAIGQNQPCLDDGKDTPYLKATLQEISRHCPHLALTVQHNTTKDTYIGGYFIPKQTSVRYIFLYTINIRRETAIKRSTIYFRSNITQEL